MPITIDPTLPADSESPRQGASRIRNIVLNLLSLVGQGGGNAVTFNNPPFLIDSNGNVQVPTTLVVPVPTVGTQATTKTYVDTGDSNTLSASQSYTNTQIAGLSITIPAATTSTVSNSIVTSNLAKGASGTLLQVTSTPPAVPNANQKYRAFVSSTVFWSINTNAQVAGGFLTVLSDNASLFATVYSAQATMFSEVVTFHHDLANHLSAMSDATRTNAQGPVTFTITGTVSGYSADPSTLQVNINAASGISASAKSVLAISWLPAQ